MVTYWLVRAGQGKARMGASAGPHRHPMRCKKVKVGPPIDFSTVCVFRSSLPLPPTSSLTCYHRAFAINILCPAAPSSSSSYPPYSSSPPFLFSHRPFSPCRAHVWRRAPRSPPRIHLTPSPPHSRYPRPRRSCQPKRQRQSSLLVSKQPPDPLNLLPSFRRPRPL